jgi:hypothetical protein
VLAAAEVRLGLLAKVLFAGLLLWTVDVALLQGMVVWHCAVLCHTCAPCIAFPCAYPLLPSSIQLRCDKHACWRAVSNYHLQSIACSHLDHCCTCSPALLCCCCVCPAAGQTPTDKEWFQGTADAVRQYAWLLTDTKNRNIEDVVILSGDHL